jgi:hypothetical protein
LRALISLACSLPPSLLCVIRSVIFPMIDVSMDDHQYIFHARTAWPTSRRGAALAARALCRRGARAVRSASTHKRSARWMEVSGEPNHFSGPQRHVQAAFHLRFQLARVVVNTFCITRASLGGPNRKPNMYRVHYTSLFRGSCTLPITPYMTVQIILYHRNINNSLIKSHPHATPSTHPFPIAFSFSL